MRRSGRLYFAVMLGSALGAAGRYLLSLATLQLAPPVFPWGTLAANVLGSLLIGLYATLTGPDGRVLAGPAARQFVMVGVLGGFTTFSVFSLETVTMAVDGRLAAAGLYAASALLLWVPAAWAGHALATRFNRLRGASNGSTR